MTRSARHLRSLGVALAGTAVLAGGCAVKLVPHPTQSVSTISRPTESRPARPLWPTGQQPLLLVRPVVQSLPSLGGAPTDTPATAAPSASAGNPTQNPTQLPPPPAQSSTPVPSQAGRQGDDAEHMRADLLGYACPIGADPLAGHDNPAQALITCDTAGQVRYLLGPSVLDRSAITKATAQADPNGAGWVVQVTFTSAGAKTWGDLTTRSIGQQIAFVINTTVVSAPTVQEAIVGSSTQISGNFTQDQAQQLAAALSTH